MILLGTWRVHQGPIEHCLWYVSPDVRYNGTVLKIRLGWEWFRNQNRFGLLSGFVEEPKLIIPFFPFPNGIFFKSISGLRGDECQFKIIRTYII